VRIIAASARGEKALVRIESLRQVERWTESMPDEINDLRLFAQMVDAGSLSAAARRTDGSTAAMSRRLAALEKRLGVRLVTRTSRRFDLTMEGTRFHERAVAILQAVDDAEAEISAQARVPQGLLCIGAPSEIGRKQIAPLIEAFSDRYPEVEVRLVLSDIGLDVIDDNLDVALRIGLPADTGVIAKKLLSSRRIVRGARLSGSARYAANARRSRHARLPATGARAACFRSMAIHGGRPAPRGSGTRHAIDRERRGAPRLGAQGSRPCVEGAVGHRRRLAGGQAD
jgi:DNA-binding transcriptional LysR family regulator